jgi:hypothetical protein
MPNSNSIILPDELIASYPWVKNYILKSQSLLSTTIKPEEIVIRLDGVEVQGGQELPINLKSELLEVIYRDGDREEIGILKYLDEILIDRFSEVFMSDKVSSPE